ncbi:MAG: uracil-DNA glycosylase, partial [Chloroflexi bacterium]|nr:uracil-DNA glycosylase [Chloroflexota bacterium]
ETITKLHGKARNVNGTICYAMYHPAAALHQQTLRQTIQADMLRIPSLIADMQRLPEPQQKPQQLSMF